MFNNGKNKSMSTNGSHKSAQPSINMLSEGTTIKGSLETKDDIRISGELEGDLTVKGKFILSKTGRISGNVEAVEADVAGQVDGEIITTQKLTLRQSAVVKGNINTKILLIEEGARFEGSCSMSANPVQKKEQFQEKKLLQLSKS